MPGKQLNHVKTGENNNRTKNPYWVSSVDFSKFARVIFTFELVTKSQERVSIRVELPIPVHESQTVYISFLSLQVLTWMTQVDMYAISRIKFVSESVQHPIKLLHQHLSQTQLLLHLFLETNWYQMTGGVVVFGTLFRLYLFLTFILSQIPSNFRPQITMSTRYWNRRNSHELELNEDNLERVFDFIEKQPWLYEDLRTYKGKNRASDWLECFFCFISTFLIDYAELRRFVWSSRIRPKFYESSNEVQAVAIFIWQNIRWLKDILPEFLKIIDPTIDIDVTLM